MTVEARIEGDVLVVEITERDRFWCMSNGQRIARSDIVAARVATWTEVRAELGWRVGGTYVPGRVAAGWYLIKKRKGCRQLLAVFRDRSSLLMVDTRLKKPARLVIATPAAAQLVAALSRPPG